MITTIAGTGVTGFSGDGGPATLAQITASGGIAVDHYGNIFFADGSNHRVRRIDAATGNMSTIAGSGPTGPSMGGYAGDGGPATIARLNGAVGLAIDKIGNLFVVDAGNHVIRKIHPSGIINTICGSGSSGFGGDGGPAIFARLSNPYGISIDDTGNIYIADRINNRIRKISTGNHLPFFISGHIQYLALCQDSARDISSMLGITDADAGQPLSWVLYDAPHHGTAMVAYSSTSTGGAVATAGLMYTPTPGYTGNDTFRVRVDDTTSADFTTIYVTVNPAPSAGSLAGSDTLCAGDTMTLAGATTGGTWSSAGMATVSPTGMVTGVGTGTAVISYTVTNSCGSDITIHTITVLSAIDCALGIPAATANALALWPNPVTTETITVSIPGNGEDATVTITNCLGQAVSEMIFATGKKVSISLDIANGVYFISARSADACRVERVVVAR